MAIPFLNVVDPFDHVRGIIWGHIHQEFEKERGEVKLLGTPSTCLQFVLESDIFAIDDKAPAYRKFILKNEGSIATEVIYL